MTSNNIFYVLGAAFVGIVSAAGMFIAEHYRQERRRHAMSRDLARLNQQLLTVQMELAELKQIHKHKNTSKTKRSKSHSVKSDSSSRAVVDGYVSTTDVDSSDLEFYDLSDEETVAPLEEILQEIDDKLVALDLETVQEGLNTLINLSLKHNENPEILWRIGKAHHNLAVGESDVSLKRDHIAKGLEACQKAIDINPYICDAQKWCGLLIGYRACFVSIKEKIVDGYSFKKHIEAALALSPNDPTLHHMLGRFAFETAGLSWYARKLATAFFAEPPNHTFDDALEYFVLAEKLSNHDWKENKLFIAECLIALERNNEAVDALLLAKKMKQDSLDTKIENRIDELLGKYNI